jgi:hypothetical protein
VAQHVRGAWSSRFHEDRLRGQADDDWAFMRLLIDEIEHSLSLQQQVVVGRRV